MTEAFELRTSDPAGALDRLCRAFAIRPHAAVLVDMAAIVEAARRDDQTRHLRERAIEIAGTDPKLVSVFVHDPVGGGLEAKLRWRVGDFWLPPAVPLRPGSGALLASALPARPGGAKGGAHDAANDAARDDVAKLVAQQIEAASDGAAPDASRAPYADGVKVVVTAIAFGSAPGERTTDGAAFRRAWYAVWANHVDIQPEQLAALAPSGGTGWIVANLTLHETTHDVPFRMFAVFDKDATGHWQLVHVHFATSS